MPFIPRTMKELLETQLTKVPDRISPGILPKGGTLMVAGGAKIGKSFVLSEFSRALATGMPLFDLEQLRIPTATKILSVEGEIGEYGTQKRGKLTYADLTDRALNNLVVVTKEEAFEWKLDTKPGLMKWREAVEIVRPEVLLVDPLGAFHLSDENSQTDMERIFHAVEDLKSVNPEMQMSVVLTHHSGKPSTGKDGRDPLDPYSMRGASKLFDRPDSILMLNRVGDLPGLPHNAWKLGARFTIRQDEGIDDFYLHVNERADSRVRFYQWKSTREGAMVPLKIAHQPDPKSLKAIQLEFTKPIDRMDD